MKSQGAKGDMTPEEDWIFCKQEETRWKNRRHRIEDKMAIDFGIQQAEGVQTFYSGEFEIKATGRFNRKVDGDTLQDLARENGLESYLPTLFRWTPELAMTAWKATSKDITDKLAGAITTTPGRPSFAITKKMEAKEMA